MSDLVRQSDLPSAEKWAQLRDTAVVLVKSGFCPSAMDTPEKVMAVGLAAHELNIPLMTALRSMFVTDGKVGMGYGLALGLAQGRIPDFQFQVVNQTNESATFKARRNADSPWTERTFTMEDAKRVKTRENNKYVTLAETKRYKNYPKDLLLARAAMPVLRVVAADILHNIYSPDEIADFAPVKPIAATGDLDKDFERAGSGTIEIALPAAPEKPVDAPEFVQVEVIDPAAPGDGGIVEKSIDEIREDYPAPEEDPATIRKAFFAKHKDTINVPKEVAQELWAKTSGKASRSDWDVRDYKIAMHILAGVGAGTISHDLSMNSFTQDLNVITFDNYKED